MENPSTATSSVQGSPATSSTTPTSGQSTQSSTDSHVDTASTSSETPSGKDFADVSSASQQSTVPNREAIKMSKLEKQSAEYQSALQQQNEWILRDQNRTVAYLRDQGLNDVEVQQAMGLITQQYPELWNQPQPTNLAQESQRTPTYDDIVNEVQSRFEQTMQVKQAQSTFFQAVPEMDPKLVSQLAPEDRNLIANFAGQVDELARTLGRVQGMGYDQALIASYNVLRGRSPSPQAGRDYGQMNRANTSNSAVYNTSRTGQSFSSGNTLSAQERAMADKIGMNYSDYAKWKAE